MNLSPLGRKPRVGILLKEAPVWLHPFIVSAGLRNQMRYQEGLLKPDKPCPLKEGPGLALFPIH